MEKPTKKYISVIGDGISDPATTAIAEQVGRLIARAGAILICGGLGGVMEAACRGAKAEGGATVGILPGLDRSEGNPYLDYVVCSGAGHGRNLAVAASGDAVIAIGGGFGTLSEIGLAGKTGRRIVLLNSWVINRNGLTPERILQADSPAGALLLALAD